MADKKHGHPRFYEMLDEFADLHSRKNHDYAAGGDPLGNFRRVAKICSLYPNLDLSDAAVIAIIYSLKQLDAVLWMYSNKHEAQVEGIDKRLPDISVYTMLARIMEETKPKT